MPQNIDFYYDSQLFSQLVVDNAEGNSANVPPTIELMPGTPLPADPTFPLNFLSCQPSLLQAPPSRASPDTTGSSSDTINPQVDQQPHDLLTSLSYPLDPNLQYPDISNLVQSFAGPSTSQDQPHPLRLNDPPRTTAHFSQPSSSSVSDTSKNEKKTYLTNFLKTSWIGIAILFVFRRDNGLTDRFQNLLAAILLDVEINRQVVRQFIDSDKPIQKIEIKKETFQYLADCIQATFRILAPVWYTPFASSGGSSINASGKLWERYNYIKKILKEAGVLVKTDSGNPNGNYAVQSHVPSEQLSQALEWLKHNVEPWAQVFKLWCETFFVRQSSDSGYSYFEFPCVKISTGKDLICYDFVKKQPGKENSLFAVWDQVKAWIISYAKEKKIEKKDAVAAKILAELPKIAPGHQDAAILRLFCCLLKPSQLTNSRGGAKPTSRKRKRVDESSNKENTEPSTKEQVTETGIVEKNDCPFWENFIVFVEIAADIETTIEKRNAVARAKKQTVQPYILCVGTFIQVSSVYVIVDDIKYSVETTLKGLDLAFKIFWAASLEYPRDCVIVWLFFQRAIYGIKASTDKTGTQLNKLFSSLHSMTGISVQ